LRASHVAAIAICAALYAAAIAVTAPIPTPWGVGHFRPGVVVPAFFALVYGPYVGGLGAALGTFIGSVILASVGLSNPFLSLVSGVPGNFVGFFILGYLMSRVRSWYRFVWSALISLFFGNLVAAAGVVSFFTLIVPKWASWSIEAKLGTVGGLTLFWLSTMLPFVLIVVPALIRATAPILSRGGGGVTAPRFTAERLTRLMSMSLSLAAVLLLLFVTVWYTPVGDFFFAKVIAQDRLVWVKSLIVIAAGSVAVFGPLTVVIGGSR
jgi:uncharacterized membrane protein